MAKQEVSRIVIEIPKEFIGHFMADRFSDALNRLKADAHCLAGNYEKETAEMLIMAMQNAEVREVMNSAWIPVTTRPMDSEEREYWSDHFGYPLDDEDAVIFDCKMPEDGQKILVSYSTFVSMDTCEIDGGCYGLEENGDWEGVTAWMPMPEHYKEEI